MALGVATPWVERLSCADAVTHLPINTIDLQLPGLIKNIKTSDGGAERVDDDDPLAQVREGNSNSALTSILRKSTVFDTWNVETPYAAMLNVESRTE